MAKNKCCPVCNSKYWDYDVFFGCDTFCNGCYHKVMSELRKLGYSVLSDKLEPCMYFKAIGIAKKDLYNGNW